MSLKYDPGRPLFLPSIQNPQDAKQYALTDSSTVLDQAYAVHKPVLIYIHGRAKGIGEPQKSVDEKIYEELGNQVSMVGFTWDAAGRGFHEEFPYASAPAFDDFLGRLAAYLSAHPGAQRPSLLAHSMGNLVVTRLAESGRLGSDRGVLFRNIVFNASAAMSENHQLWLDKILAAERSYVMVNENDRVLLGEIVYWKVHHPFGRLAVPLGRKVQAPAASSPRCTYVDLRDLGVNHRYFQPSHRKNQAGLTRFFDAVLVGEAADFTGIADLEKIDGVTRQTIRHSVLAAAPHRDQLPPDDEDD